jgi:hypothetical protein
MMECPSEEPLFFSSEGNPRSAATCKGLPILFHPKWNVELKEQKGKHRHPKKRD